MKNHIVISTLREDMVNIFGRPLTEDGDNGYGDEEPAPEPEEDGGNAMEPDEDPPMGEGEDDDDDDDKPFGGKKAPPFKKEDSHEDDDEDDPADTEEALGQIATLASGFLSAHTRGPIGESRLRRAGKSKKNKPFVKPRVESKRQRVQRLAEGKIFSTAPAPSGHRRSQSRIQALLEEVGSIVGDIHRSRRVEQIKGFANIAVIAEMLEGRFRAIGMDLSEGGIYKVAGVMKRLSEQASDVAIGLDSPDEPGDELDEVPPGIGPSEQDPTPGEGGDDAMVDEMFKKLMAKLLDALQLYNDVTGKEEMEPEPGEDDEPEDEASAAEYGDGGDYDDEPADDDDEEDVVRVGEQDDPPPSDDDDEEDDEEPVAEGDDPTVGGSGGAPPDGPYGQPDPEQDNAMSEALRLVRAMRRAV